jgi:hypothetical protein
VICWNCNHNSNDHEPNVTPHKATHFCFRCINDGISNQPFDYAWHDLETNLDYIERLAKEKNLI